MSMGSGVLLAVLLAATPQAGAALDVQAKAIESALIAPCCFRQQVSVHSSPAADEVRRDVRARLAAGETPAEILDAYVARYGKRILAEPPAEGFGAALQLAPFVMAFAGIGLLAFIVRRLTRAVPAIATAGGHLVPTPDDQAHLDEALRDLD
jgi:cytochrome c-type biogenesis protein CcmH/NrfF